MGEMADYYLNSRDPYDDWHGEGDTMPRRSLTPRQKTFVRSKGSLDRDRESLWNERNQAVHSYMGHFARNAPRSTNSQTLWQSAMGDLLTQGNKQFEELPFELKIGDQVMATKRKQLSRKTSRSREKVLDWRYAGTVTIVGGKHHHEFTALNQGLLNHGAIIDYRREPKNPHDPRAIEAYVGGLKVGYIAKTQNGLLSTIMDMGLKAKGELLTRQVDSMQARIFIAK
jgi:hypothetical protein